MTAPRLGETARDDGSAHTASTSAPPLAAPSTQTSAVMATAEPDEPLSATVVSRDFDVESSGVKDRWSRYIGAMGLDAVRKQTASTVFISGLNTLGAEIAKNVVLSGVKKLAIHDNTSVQVCHTFCRTSIDLNHIICLQPHPD